MNFISQRDCINSLYIFQVAFFSPIRMLMRNRLNEKSLLLGLILLFSLIIILTKIHLLLFRIFFRFLMILIRLRCRSEASQKGRRILSQIHHLFQNLKSKFFNLLFLSVVCLIALYIG